MVGTFPALLKMPLPVFAYGEEVEIPVKSGCFLNLPSGWTSIGCVLGKTFPVKCILPDAGLPHRGVRQTSIFSARRGISDLPSGGGKRRMTGVSVNHRGKEGKNEGRHARNGMDGVDADLGRFLCDGV